VTTTDDPSGPDEPDDAGSARYAFAVRFRLDALAADWEAAPRRIERTCYRTAPPPGEPGWLFFRDHLWRGEANHPGHLADLVEDAFSLPVEHVEFRGLRTDETHFEALKHEIDSDLNRFNADSMSEVLTKYLGSSIRVET